jgi:hypothetical protein
MKTRQFYADSALVQQLKEHSIRVISIELKFIYVRREELPLI